MPLDLATLRAWIDAEIAETEATLATLRTVE